MNILGIETSCDETAAAVVRGGREIMSSVVASQVERHAVFGGVVPEIASRMHCEAISGVVRKALSDAGLTLDDVDGVAVTAYPGLIGALLVGVNFAKSLGFSAGKPVVPVHHLRGHIASNYLTHPALEPPFLCLVVSGGHTHIVEVTDYTKMHLVGRTRDDAAGECFDKTARTLGLPYPGGLNMDRLADEGDPDAYKFPSPKVEGAPYDFSFSGLKSAVINTIHNKKQRGEEIVPADMAASIRRTVSDILCGRFLLAARDLGYARLAAAGGVAANSLLRRDLADRCAGAGFELYLPDMSLCGDNAAMIASQGYYELLAGNTAGSDLNASASMAI
ncbi:MAG: tRNA (adenosine(37)-N6)-threonylcarbamoyltransferase complex transferase subunit TsaD [Oscillospiraceae bacterium]|nr:tRNA (adenosine(37)-N6)-threonylcarbamoyltransferase complex transferase subunit TsaD [Oscillospiraceae bacterium]